MERAPRYCKRCYRLIAIPPTNACTHRSCTLHVFVLLSFFFQWGGLHGAVQGRRVPEFDQEKIGAAAGVLRGPRSGAVRRAAKGRTRDARRYTHTPKLQTQRVKGRGEREKERERESVCFSAIAVDYSTSMLIVLPYLPLNVFLLERHR